MRHGWLIGIAFIATSVSACSSSGGGSSGGPGTATEQPVTVTIGVVYRGGPAPGNSHHLVPGTVHLTGSGVNVSRRVTDGHSATFRVPQGNYIAIARSGDAQCHAANVVVKPGTKSPSLIRCDVK